MFFKIITIKSILSTLFKENLQIFDDLFYYLMAVITLFSDFGYSDGYHAIMKGVINSINPIINIIDISHSIQHQNIIQGAFILYNAIEYFQDGIHVAVVDPGVGSERAGLIVQCENGILVGPDNGLMIPAAERLGINEIYKITNQKYWLDTISSTFHGRDIFAPVAAHISKGVAIEELGEKTDEFETLEIFNTQLSDNKITGIVLNIDKFGNIITNITKEMVLRYFKNNDKIEVSKFNESFSQEIPLKATYSDVSKDQLVAIISSTGFLEIAGNQCRADAKLNFKISEYIVIQ
jgi:S-adenosylmethionine hydrolase